MQANCSDLIFGLTSLPGLTPGIAPVASIGMNKPAVTVQSSSHRHIIYWTTEPDANVTARIKNSDIKGDNKSDEVLSSNPNFTWAQKRSSVSSVSN